jgi:predicted SprT family Zn-dependent metalloprotease
MAQSAPETNCSPGQLYGQVWHFYSSSSGQPGAGSLTDSKTMTREDHAHCRMVGPRSVSYLGEEKQDSRSRVSKYSVMQTITETTLQSWTDFYNWTIFEGKLHSVTVRWSNHLVTTAGKTKYFRSARRCDIELNPKLLDTEPKTRNTLVHELCHAAVFLIDQDSQDGHGPRWRTWVTLATDVHKELEITVYHHYRASYGFYYVCSSSHGLCNLAYGSFRPQSPESLRKYRCGRCQAPLRYTSGAMTTHHLYLAHIQRAKRTKGRDGTAAQQPGQKPESSCFDHHHPREDRASAEYPLWNAPPSSTRANGKPISSSCLKPAN